MSTPAPAVAVAATATVAAAPAHVAAVSSGLLLQSDPLHRAVKAGRWAEVAALISACGTTRQARSFYVNRKDANGSSPAFHCVWWGKCSSNSSDVSSNSSSSGWQPQATVPDAGLRMQRHNQSGKRGAVC
jgi:hypothetical protein